MGDNLEEVIISALRNSPPVWLGSVAMFGVFSVVIIREILQRTDARRLRKNGSAHIPHPSSGDPVIILLEDIAESVRCLPVVREDAAAARRASEGVADAALGHHARTPDGGYKWYTEESVEMRDVLRQVNAKLDKVLELERERPTQ